VFLKCFISFSIYSKAGANLKIMEIVQCFISNCTFFLKFLCISEKQNWEEKKKKTLAKKISRGNAITVIALPYSLAVKNKLRIF